MKAVVLTRLGGIDTLVYSDVEKPIVQENEALIKVLYCGVNHLDTLIRQGKRPGPTLFPHILGSEIVGEITSISDQKHFKLGDKVAVYPWTFDETCKQCLSGNEQICEHMGTIGRTTWGGYAEYVNVPIQNLIAVSSDSNLADVCAITLTGTTAVHLLERSHIQDNSIVLITGATGGVGTLLIQLLKQKHCTIICSTSHANKIDQLKKLGAAYVISSIGIVPETKTIVPDGVDYAIDIVGGTTWSNVVETLGKNGTMVFCATSQEEMGQIAIGNAFSKQLNILGSYGGSRKHLQTAIELLQKGRFKPVIDSTFPLKDAATAHEKIDTQSLFGKILIH